jgi:hypothetical protein
MKQYLSMILAVACLALVIVLIVTKRGDDTQHESDTGTITDFSNRLDVAETHASINNGTALIFSNKLNESQSVLLTFSNQLTEAQSTLVFDTEQITNLNQQVTDMKTENQTLDQRLVVLAGQMTNQLATLTATQASLTETNKNLVQLGKDYALLENRFRIDVAERVVVERKFNNLQELKTQTHYVKKHPHGAISAESIYAGLNVEVHSNGTYHAISPQ